MLLSACVNRRRVEALPDQARGSSLVLNGRHYAAHFSGMRKV